MLCRLALSREYLPVHNHQAPLELVHQAGFQAPHLLGHPGPQAGGVRPGGLDGAVVAEARRQGFLEVGAVQQDVFLPGFPYRANPGPVAQHRPSNHGRQQRTASPRIGNLGIYPLAAIYQIHNRPAMELHLCRGTGYPMAFIVGFDFLEATPLIFSPHSFGQGILGVPGF
ncbi:hypothetical protein [Meiothermus sp.]|uniref:hypothetical protein n=1 Tax=Meiothermus sp. TaxID=1955249 RepID=UPI00260BEE29|nr:hypothetical protein [Meiothermus sp.]